MSIYTRIFKQTAIYGLAAVFPKVIGFFLVPFHTQVMPDQAYGQYSVVFAIITFFNVILAFGMETAFFRYYNMQDNKKSVNNTATLFLLFTTLCFLAVCFFTQEFWSSFLNISSEVFQYVIWILALDTLVIIPFAKLRANQRSAVYSVIKMGNVLLFTLLNVFFLYLLPKLATAHPESIWTDIYKENYQVAFLFLANLIASLATFLIFIKHYLQLKLSLDITLTKQMLRYAFPIMIGGLAFATNEGFDKILLERLLPKDIALSQVGQYAACYKLGLFMVLFRQAYTLGIEPFFFNYAKNDDAPIKYATITKYFTIIGSLIMLVIIVFSDVLKVLIIRNQEYWPAMSIVPMIILANLCMGIYTNLSVWYKLKDKTLIGAYISITGAILTLIFNFALIPYIGYIGSAIATLIAYGAMMLISYILGQKYYPIPYDTKAISGYFVLSIVFSFIYFYFFRENYYVGISLIVVYLCVLVKEQYTNLLRLLKR